MHCIAAKPTATHCTHLGLYTQLRVNPLSTEFYFLEVLYTQLRVNPLTTEFYIFEVLYTRSTVLITRPVSVQFNHEDLQNQVHLWNHPGEFYQ